MRPELVLDLVGVAVFVHEPQQLAEEGREAVRQPVDSAEVEHAKPPISEQPEIARKGTLAVEHGNPSPPPRLNYRTCRETETISTWTKVVGSQSSGLFWGARGNGHAVVVFSAIAPRYTSGPNKGQCNFSENAQPEPYGAWISFHAQGTLYLRHRHH